MHVLDKEMVLGRIPQDNAKFYHVTENDVQFRMYELFTGFHLKFLDQAGTVGNCLDPTRQQGKMLKTIYMFMCKQQSSNQAKKQFMRNVKSRYSNIL